MNGPTTTCAILDNDHDLMAAITESISGIALGEPANTHGSSEGSSPNFASASDGSAFIFSLRLFPLEIREMIYAASFDIDRPPCRGMRHGDRYYHFDRYLCYGTPSLLKAMRADENLYAEGLKTYYGKATLQMTWNSFSRQVKTLSRLSFETMGLIKKIEIELRPRFQQAVWGTGGTSLQTMIPGSFLFDNQCGNAIVSAYNLEELHVITKGWWNLEEFKRIHLATCCCPQFRQLTVCDHGTGAPPSVWVQEMLVPYNNEIFGMKGTLMAPADVLCSFPAWRWKAEKGKRLWDFDAAARFDSSYFNASEA